MTMTDRKQDTNWRCVGCSKVGTIRYYKYICNCRKKHLVCVDCYDRLGGSWEAWENDVFGSRCSVLDHEQQDCTRLQYENRVIKDVWSALHEKLHGFVGPVGCTARGADVLLFQLTALIFSAILVFLPLSLKLLLHVFYCVSMFLMLDFHTRLRLLFNWNYVACFLTSLVANVAIQLWDMSSFLTYSAMFLSCLLYTIESCRIQARPRCRHSRSPILTK